MKCSEQHLAMQKLIRRSFSTPILCNSSPPLPSSFGNSIARNRNRVFFSSAFKNNRKASVAASDSASSLSTTQLFIMPAATIAAGSSLASPYSQNPSSFSSRAVNEKRFARSSRFSVTVSGVGSRNCAACRCLTECGTQSRAWVVLKEGRNGYRAAWLHTESDRSLFSTAVECKRNPDTDLKENDGEEDEKVVDDKPLRLNKRQKGLVSGSGIHGNLDLLAIPGVGPRNLRKLVENGIAGVAELKQLYKDKFFGESREKMVEYLQSSVGIIHKNHAESITTFIEKTVDEELKDGSGGLQPIHKNRITLCVEGNISVGKTTFLQRIANETIELRDLVEIVPEPINKWQDIGPDHFNILDAFYAEPERYAYTFQNYVFVTRVMQERESSGGLKPLRLMERSVFSDRMVFVRAVHEANWMNEMEISIYDSWFDPVVSCLPGLIPDGFIYLRASPDTCHNRMKQRSRAEEGGVSLEYLRDLHEKHESWLFPFESGNHGVLSVSKLPLQIDSSLPPQIRDRVFYLEGNHMHPSIQKVPALVLDCEPNIDFSKDIEAKSEYARQVADFFEFVKKKKEVTTTSTKTGEAPRNAQSLILPPQKGGFWVPNGNHFPESGFQSLDFKRAMSFMSG